MIGKLPFDGLRNKITIMNANAETNNIMLCWDFKNDEPRQAKNSLTMLEQILRNKARGSLYAVLAENNYVNQIEVDANDIMKTAFKLFTVEIELTESGLLAYQEVIAIIFEYLRKVKDEWLVDGQTLDLLEEYKTMS